MKIHHLQKNINRTLGTAKSRNHKAYAGFFGDDDLLRKKTKLKVNFEKSLSNELPYSHYDEEQDLYFNEIQSDVGEEIKINCGFLLEADPMVGCSIEKIDILSNLFTDALPEGLIVQVINYASPRVGNILDSWKKERTKEGGIYVDLANKRADHFLKFNWSSAFSTPFVVRDFRLYIAVWLDIEKYPDAPNRLKDLREIFISNLQNIGVNCQNLQPDGLLSFLDEIFNPQKNKTHIEEVQWDQLNSLHSQIIDSESSFDIKKNRIELRDDIAICSLSVKQFPSQRYWPLWEMVNLLGSETNDHLRLSCPFAQIFTFYVLSEEGSATKAMVKSTRADQQAKSRMRGFIPGIEQKAKDWKFVFDHINSGKRLLEANYRVLLFADTKKLAKEEETLKGLFKTLGFTISRDEFNQLPSFLASMPFWLNEKKWKEIKSINKARTLLSWTAANLAPMMGEHKGSIAEPQILLFGKRGQPVFFNPFYAPVAGGNYNCAVIGKSGSGKSVFLQEQFTSVRGAGGMVFIIDDGKSFVNSSLCQDGKFIEIKEGICINPFTMFEWDSIASDKDYQGAIQNFFTSLICQICRFINPINEDEKAIIGKAVSNVIDRDKNQGSLELIEQELLKVATTAKQKEVAESLQLSLGLFIKKYGHFFAGKSDIQMDNPLIVFELSNIKGDEMKDLKSVIMMILMHLIGEKIYKGDRKTRSTLIIDEAWDLLHGEGMRAFIEGYVRRVRKYGGNLVTGTQSINDYYKNSAARAVLENSQWKIFLAQNRDSIDYLKTHNVISMDKALEEALKGLKMVKGCYSDVLVYGDSGWFVARLALDPFSIFLYSSTADDVARLEDLKKQGLSIADAVNQIVTERTSVKSSKGGKL